MKIHRRSIASLVFAAAGLVWAGSFDEGERLFREDKPALAAPLLEKAVLESGTDERAWLYLGVCYIQMGKLDQAAATFRKGLAAATRYKQDLYYNLGIVFVLQGKNTFAAEMFGEAITIDATYSAAYLNRANARVNTKEYAAAVSDYRRYLDLEPESPKRPQIEQLIGLLEQSAAEAARLAAEAEAKRLAEEAARKALLDQLAASLKESADETTSMSAGAGQVQGYGDELELDE
jgi:tetratricopeptide (TPR) repeat protein